MLPHDCNEALAKQAKYQFALAMQERYLAKAMGHVAYSNDLAGAVDFWNDNYGSFVLGQPGLSSTAFQDGNEQGWDCCWDTQQGVPIEDCINNGRPECETPEAWHYPEAYDQMNRRTKFEDFVPPIMRARAVHGSMPAHRMVTGYNWYRFWDINYDLLGNDGGPTDGVFFTQNWGLAKTHPLAETPPYMPPYEELGAGMQIVNTAVQEAIGGAPFWPSAPPVPQIVIKQDPPQ